MKKLSDQEVNSLAKAITELKDPFAQPKKKWVGLTDEELEFYTEELGQGELGRGVLRAVVDFLKEKNT